MRMFSLSAEDRPELQRRLPPALKGLRVTVLDSRKPPIDKPCGEGLLPEAVAALHRLGVEPDPSLIFPFSGFRFSDEISSASALIPNGKACGLRRTVLHRLLVERAAEVGVSFLWGTSNFAF